MRATFFALAAWIGLWAVEAAPATWVHQCFSGPAAHLAGLLLGVPVMDAGDAERLFWLLPHPVLDLHVGRECSGMNFFLVALLLLAWGVPWPRRARDAWPLLALIPVAYLFTLMANALRLAAVFQSRILAEWLLPPTFFSLVHLVSGGLVFLTILILLHLLHESFQQSRTT
jgi:exosortase/archaeosortase family protein